MGGQTKYGGGDYTMAWDGDTITFFDYSTANGGYTEAKLEYEAPLSSIRYFPRGEFIEGRYAGGTFVGITAAGTELLLATIVEDPFLNWALLNVSASEKVTSVRYNSPD